MPLYACPGSLLFVKHQSRSLSRIPMLHMQILTLLQDPDTSHAKPCVVSPHAREASQQCQQFLTLFQAHNSSHANPSTRTGSQIFKQPLALGQPPNNSNTSLWQCRLLKLHMQIITLV
ncbi:hypothetical protein O181_106259 [Austropuccinia psidii MF-1]|uniref:Uncharacterized protein n=1 Tax=Austropuccinia psidii MF-1 TaxID=1389203 RepID=A0A9Q3JRS2_9BASI|nr:hypothetical protein [Austropuccinia psidii MF-1]